MLGLLSDADTREVEPLILTCLVITGNHVSVGHIIAETVRWLCAWATCVSVARVSATPRDQSALHVAHIRGHARELAIQASRLLGVHLVRQRVEHDGGSKSTEQFAILLKGHWLYKPTWNHKFRLLRSRISIALSAQYLPLFATFFLRSSNVMSDTR